MKQFVAHLFMKCGNCAHTLQIFATSHAEAKAKAHDQLGSAEALKRDNLDLWVVPA